MATTLVGYIGLGTNNAGTFTEMTGTSYARQSVTLTSSSTVTTNSGSVTWTPGATDWSRVGQYGLFLGSSGGTPLLVWNAPSTIPLPTPSNPFVLNANQLQLTLNTAAYTTGLVTLWKNGDIIGHDDSYNMIYVASPLSFSNSVIQSNNQLAGMGTRLGVIIGANANATTDQRFQAVGWGSGTFLIDKIVATNASTSLTTAAGGVYPSASKAGTAIVANTQVYTTLTASTLWVALTLSTAGGQTVYSSMPYFSLTTPQGGAATVDLHLFGQVLA